METNLSPFAIKTTQTEDEVKQIFAFSISVLGDLEDTIHTLVYYLDHFHKTPGLLVYAENNGQVIGSTMGSIDGDHVHVGMVAVAPHARRLGIGLAMMERLEAEAKKLGQTTLILGARQEAEPFYLRCGYRPNLFIQIAGAGHLEELKRLNQQYPVIWEADKAGWTRLMLVTPQIDRELQDKYHRQFPDCSTQYVFIKDLSPAPEG